MSENIRKALTATRYILLLSVLIFGVFAFFGFGCGGGGGGGNPVAPIPVTTTTPDITGPASGSIFAPGSNIVISVDLKDETGSVSKVEFYSGLEKLGESMAAPFSFVWVSPPPGTYTLTIRAYNSAGAILVSNAVQVSVAGTGPQKFQPTVFISQPVNGAIFLLNATAGITITASASRQDGVINKVEFYSGPLLLGQASSPFSISWKPPIVGSYSLLAKAYDNWGLTATSPYVSIIVVSSRNATPTATMTQPIPNAIYSAGSSITITVLATDSDGLIDRVEFYQANAKIGETRYSSSSPTTFTMVWLNVPVGSYSLTAKAIDQYALATTTDPVRISVNPVPNRPPSVALTQPASNTSYPFGSDITLVASATDLDGTVDLVEFFRGAVKLGEVRSSPFKFIWTHVTMSGIFVLTAKATDNNGAIATSTSVSISVTATPNSSPTVVLTAPVDGMRTNEGSSIILTASASDSDGTIANVEFFQGTTKLGESHSAPYSCQWTSVPAGTYVLTARATDNSGASAVSSGATILVNTAPVVTLTQPADLAIYTLGDVIDFAANATDADGIVKVEFFSNGVKRGEDTWPPFTFRWLNPTAGKQVLHTTALDSLDAVGTSSAVTVWVNIPPTALITHPLDRTGFLLGADVVINVDAQDPDGTISSVQFLADGSLLAALTTPPYTYTWRSPASGSHAITARAFDDMGASRVSSASNIVVRDTPVPAIVINGGDAITSRHSVEITTNAEGQAAMWLSEDGAFTGVASEAVPIPPAVRLYQFPPTAGNRKIYARFLDSSGIYRYSEDDIDVIGPASASISCSDTQPINQGVVNLNLFAVGASEMLIQLDPTDSTAWQAYRTRLAKIVPTTGGQQTIYARFRNDGGVETATLTLSVTLSSAPPSGNKPEFRASVDSSSSLITEVGVGSLPVYLHFSIADSRTASVAYALVHETQSAPVWPTDYTVTAKPVFPVKLTKTTTPAVQEGQNILYFRFADGLGNWTDVAVVSLKVTPLQYPAPTLVINDGDASTNQRNVTLTINAPGQNAMWLSGDGIFTGVASEAVPVSPAVRLYQFSPTAGNRKVYARFLDSSGIYKYSQDDIDVVGPSGASISCSDTQPINQGVVNLDLSAVGASEMLIQLDPTDATPWQAYRTRLAKIVPTTGGQQTIYARFRNDGGVETATSTLTVTLSSVPPSGNKPEFRATVDPASSLITEVGVGSLPVYLHFSIADSRTASVAYALVHETQSPPVWPTDYIVTAKPVSPVRLTKTTTPAVQEGQDILYYRFADGLGNWTDVTVVSLKVTPFQYPAPTLVINDGDSSTNLRNVTLAIIAPGQSAMWLSADGNFSGIASEAIPLPPAVRLYQFPTTAGNRKVYARFLDLSGIYQYSQDDIDVVGPTGASISSSDTQPINQGVVNLNLSAIGATEMLIQLDPNDATPWQAFQTRLARVVPTTGGQQTIYARFRNADGVEAATSTLTVTLSSIPFSGNKPEFHATVNPSSSLITEVGVGSLPVYLHFSNTDSRTASVAYALVHETQAAPVWPTDYIFTAKPVSPVKLTKTTTPGVQEGQNILYYRFADSLGNWTDLAVASLTLTPFQYPEPTLVINDGDTSTNLRNVTLKIDAPGQSAMWLSGDGNFTGVASEAVPVPPAVRLYQFPTVAGNRKVYARFLDLSGVYRYSQDDIDVAGPSGASLSSSDTQPINQGVVNLNLFAVGATEMLIQLDPNDATPWQAYQTRLARVVPTTGGQQTIYARFRNADGVETATSTLTVTLSSVPPSGNKPEFRATVDPVSSLITEVGVGSLPVYLHFSIADSRTASVAYALVHETQPAPVWPTDYTVTSKPVSPVRLTETTTPALQEGQNILYYRFADGLGNWTDVTVVSLTVTPIQYPAPTLVINGGDASTNLRNVTLTINAPGQSSMWLSGDGNFTGIASEAIPLLPAVRLYQFPTTAGNGRIYARFLDFSGNYRYSQDDIDVLGPSGASLSSSDTQPINQGVVNLNLFAIGATEMLIQLDPNDATPWQAYQTRLARVVPTSGGQQTIYARFRNAGGVETATSTLTVTLADEPLPAVVINGGDSATNRIDVTLSLSSFRSRVGTDSMWISNDGNFSQYLPRPYSLSESWPLDPLVGQKTVWVRYATASGTYVYASDSIELGGIASASITTTDAMPINAAFVNLKLYAQNAWQMIVTQDPAAFTVSSPVWVGFTANLPFNLVSGGGQQTIYAKFRTVNSVESPVVSLTITVNQTPPAGNSFKILSGIDPSSAALTEVLVASLPIFLHSDVTDALTASAAVALTHETNPAPTWPTSYSIFSTPMAPIAIEKNSGTFLLADGSNSFWYRFSDGLGNWSATKVVSVTLKGPRVKVSPTAATLYSSQTRGFTATLENLSGTLQWSLDAGSPGSIDAGTGIYSAPGNITGPATATVRATVTSGSTSYSSTGTVSLATQVELKWNTTAMNVQLGKSKDFLATVLNSTSGVTIISLNPASPVGGIATVTPPVVKFDTDYLSPPAAFPATYSLATLTYAAVTVSPPGPLPMPPGTSSVAINVAATQDNNKTAVLTANLTTGEAINPSAISANAQARTKPVTLTFTTSVASSTIDWTILGTGGSFSPSSLVTATTTKTLSDSHTRTFYAGTSAATVLVSAVWTDSGMGVPPAGTATINVQAPAELNISPTATEASAIVSPIQFTYSVISAPIDPLSGSVEWFYRNANENLIASPPGGWWPGDGSSRPSCGILTTGGLYSRPSSIPSSPATNKIELMVRFKEDQAASSVATLTLLPPVIVQIGKGYDPEPPAFSKLASTSVLLEVDTLRLVASVSNTVTKGVTWYVNDIAGGNSTFGTIDSTGLYTAPLVRPSPDTFTIKAVSNYDPTKYGTTDISLKNFWNPRITGMQNDAGTAIPIYSLLVDPVWPTATSDYLLFAGTNGYGLWFASVSSEVDAASFPWKAAGDATTLFGGPKCIINDLAVNSTHDVVAATENGVYLWRSDEAYGTAHAVLAGNPTKSVAWDRTDATYMYVTRSYGFERIRLDNAGNFLNQTPIYLNAAYRTLETRVASPPPDVTAYRDVEEATTLFSHSEFRAIALSNSDPNKLFFANEGGEIGGVSSVRTMSTPLVPGNQTCFSGPSPATYTQIEFIYILPNPTSAPRPRSSGFGVVTDLCIDPNSPWTLLMSSSQGVYRSVDSGATFISKASAVNARAVLIDPTNVTYFFYGQEAGLFRSKDAGTSWNQIKSGLGGTLVVNTFAQSEGPPGTKRRIWVGTTGGVFAGGRSLDLE
ncbi:MAG: Ig-like domain-containing protein [Candidatus Ozemobacteraceae bacterium]